MNTFILIMIITTRYDGGVVISTAEFNNKKTCKLAGLQFKKKSEKNTTFSFTCVIK